MQIELSVGYTWNHGVQITNVKYAKYVIIKKEIKSVIKQIYKCHIETIQLCANKWLV